MKKKYAGVVAPMITPIEKDGEIDLVAVRKIIETFVANDVSPLLMGTTGEGNLLSAAHASQFVTEVTATVRGRVPVYSCLTGFCFEEQVVAAEAYRLLGVDVLVATLPSYYALTEEQMYNYYTLLADTVSLPLMIYNIPSTTHISIPVEMVERLSKHPNIVGMKDSERDLERLKACIRISKGNAAFAYFCGWAAQSAYSLQLGGDGIVPSTANYVPEMFAELYRAAVAGDRETANRMQAETDAIARIYQEGRILGRQLAALKVMMGTKGLCQPYMLMPLTTLSEEEKQEVILKLT
jgi:4-hydroxy-tetrahydrodipicolinate synthase